MKTGVALAVAAGLAWWYWKREAADPNKQEVVALPQVSPMGTAPQRTTPMGADELEALTKGTMKIGQDGWTRFTDTQGTNEPKGTSGGIAW